MLVVRKFGGTSVGTPERIGRVAERVAEMHAQGTKQVVVVSAMGDTTDELLELAHQVHPSPPSRELDMLLTAGERISMSLVTMALSNKGVSAVSFTGSQSGILTDGTHQNARVHSVLGDRIRGALDSGKVAVVAGYQGVCDRTKEITTLGRGGSDTTAVALAAELGAACCEIFTDVDGIFSADPRMVPDSKHRSELTYDLALELSARGAQVLHPRSVELARKFNVELSVLNSLKTHLHKGTRVMANVKNMEGLQVTGVTSDSGKIFLRVELARPGASHSLWDHSRELHLGLLCPTLEGKDFRAFIERAAQEEWETRLKALLRDGFVSSFLMFPNISPVSVVGECFSHSGEFFGRAADALSRENIAIEWCTGGPLAATFGIGQNRLNDAVQALHRDLVEGSKCIST